MLKSLHGKRDRRRPRLTRRRLWVEYRDEVLAQGATAYGYSQFCALLKQRLESRSAPAQMSQLPSWDADVHGLDFLTRLGLRPRRRLLL